MVEDRQMLQLAFAFGLLSLFGWLYAAGGRSRKWLRRWLGSTVFVAGCNGIALWSGTWHIAFLVPFAALPAALSMGYGGDTTSHKVRRRALYGFLATLALYPFFWPFDYWLLFSVQLAISVGISVIYGVFNPTSAVGEEGLVGLALVATVPFMLIR